MRIESSFTVAAPPDRVFAHLLDVNQVVGCLPGAELSEIVDSQTFRGRLRIRVGAVSVAYSGTARIVDTVEEGDAATLTIRGDGREIGGQGSVRATLVLSVRRDEEGGSCVGLDADLTITGRVAQFGRGMIEDVSRRLIGQMGECIGDRLRTASPAG